MNLPNKLTMARILLIPVFMAVLAMNFMGHYFVALAIFAVASFTDFLDGYIARKNNLVTDFGKFADPLADKILTTTAILYLLAYNLCSPVVVAIILAREFAVSGLRMVAASSKENAVIAANMWGKVKTVLQMVAIIAIFGMLGMYEVGIFSYGSEGFIMTISYVLMAIVGLVTLISGVIYLYENRHFINTAK